MNKSPAIRRSDTRADVIIVGGGVVGAASAYFAARAGFKPLLIEKREALGTLTTAASLAAFRAQFADAGNIRMMLESITFFEGLRSEVDIGLVQHGYLFVTTAQDGLDAFKSRVNLQRSFGLEDVEVLDGDAARARFPYLGENVMAATFREKDGWLSAHELTQYYARSSAAQICLGTTVDEIIIKRGAVRGVLTDQGELLADRVVIAAGPFSRSLASRLGLELPIELLRRQHAVIKEHDLIPKNAPMTIDADTGAHWRPEGHGAILAWALPEESTDPSESVLPDWDFAARVIDGAARVTPFWNEVAAHVNRSNLDLRAGQYDMTPDARPIVSAPPEFEGLYLNCGYSGHGVMASPAGGRILADLLSRKLNEKENPFRLARFRQEQSSSSEQKMVL